MAEIMRTFRGDDIAHDAATTKLSEADVYHILDMIHTSFLDFRGEDHPMLAMLSDFMERISSEFDIQI